MKLKQLMDLYDNWNGITCINDNDLNNIVRGRTLRIMDHKSPLRRGYSYHTLFNMEVVSFGYYNDEFCVRVK